METKGNTMKQKKNNETKGNQMRQRKPMEEQKAIKGKTKKSNGEPQKNLGSVGI